MLPSLWLMCSQTACKPSKRLLRLSGTVPSSVPSSFASTRSPPVQTADRALCQAAI